MGNKDAEDDQEQSNCSTFILIGGLYLISGATVAGLTSYCLKSIGFNSAENYTASALAGVFATPLAVYGMCALNNLAARSQRKKDGGLEKISKD